MNTELFIRRCTDRHQLPGVYKKRKRLELPVCSCGCGAPCRQRVDKRLSASFPLAKVSEIDEEQEDPYLNDRCRGEPGASPGPAGG